MAGSSGGDTEHEEEETGAADWESAPPRPKPSGGFDREPTPTWDGKDPEKTYRVYKKDLRIWAGSTDIPEAKQAGRVLRRLTGDARLACEDLTEEEILSDDGVDLVLKKLDEFYGPYLEQTMPRAFESAVLLAYTASAQTRLTQLKREGVDLPAEARGYIMFRQAKLTEKAEDMVRTWTEGNFHIDKILRALRKLDKVQGGTKGQEAYYRDDGEPASFVCGDESGDSDGDDDHVLVYADDLIGKEAYEEALVSTALANY